MEYAKEKLLRIGIFNTSSKKEIWTSRILSKIKKHKIISTAIGLFFFFSAVNIILIYNFLRILQNI